MVIWLKIIIIISQKQLAEVVSVIDIISFANKISYLQALGFLRQEESFSKTNILKFIVKGCSQVRQSERGRAQRHSLQINYVSTSLDIFKLLCLEPSNKIVLKGTALNFSFNTFIILVRVTVIMTITLSSSARIWSIVVRESENL